MFLRARTNTKIKKNNNFQNFFIDVENGFKNISVTYGKDGLLSDFGV